MTNPLGGFTSLLRPEAEALAQLGICISALRVVADEIQNVFPKSAVSIRAIADRADDAWKAVGKKQPLRCVGDEA